MPATLSELSRDAGLLIIGAGNMGGAMLSAWLDGGLTVEAAQIVDPSPGETARALIENRGLSSVVSIETARAAASVVLIAVKPQQLGALLPQLARYAKAGALFATVAAGVPMRAYAEVLGPTARVVRVMPNTPSRVRAGISALFADARATDSDRALVEEMLRALGETVWLPDETLMDAVTGVSGSGPAYVFHMVEALAAAGERSGLPTELAERLARQTVIGGAMLLAADAERPAASLRREVTSPNGTTQAGLEALMDEASGLTELMTRTVAAAARRSRELGG